MKHLFIPILLVAIGFSSCKMDDVRKPNSTGKGSEILVVCDEKIWNGPGGIAIKSLFASEMAGLPESEAEFALVQVPYASFTKFLEGHRNVFIVDMKASNGKTRVETQKDVWSHPQRVIKVIVSSDTAFSGLLSRQGAAMKELFNKNERDRFAAENALSRNIKVETVLEKEYGIKIEISKDYYIGKKAEDFAWLRRETAEMSQGIIIFSVPYKSESQLKQEAIISNCKTWLQQYIPGPAEGSYMTISESVIKPESVTRTFNGNYAIETRGLWETRGDFMGGPFVNYAVLDSARQRVVSFYGYVYYPNKSKRNLVRQLEAIIRTAKFITVSAQQEPPLKR
jgi:hypothetical protein